MNLNEISVLVIFTHVKGNLMVHREPAAYSLGAGNSKIPATRPLSSGEAGDRRGGTRAGHEGTDRGGRRGEDAWVPGEGHRRADALGGGGLVEC